MSNGKVKINRGFVLGYAAIAIFALLTGFVTNYSSNLAINADAGPGSSCLTYSTVQAVEATAEEKEVFGANAVAYTVVPRPPMNIKLKILLGATETSKIGSGGIVAFTAGIQNLTDTAYTDKKGRIVLKYVDGNTEKKLDFYYGNPNLALGKYWYKTISTSMSNYSSALTLEFRNGSDYHIGACIASAMSLTQALASPTPVPSPTTTTTTTTTATTTATGDDTTTVTTTPTTTTTTTTTSVTATPTADSYNVMVKNGYNAFLVDDVFSITPFTNEDMVVFDYNRNGDKKWRSTANGDNITTTLPGLGYYVYNAGPAKTVDIEPYRTTEDPVNYAVLKKGWNLLSTEAGGTLANITVKVLKEGQALSCNQLECTRETTLEELFTGTAATRKAYGKIYQVVDGNSSDAATAFSVTEVTADNLSSVTLPAGGIYWVYLFEL